MINALGDTIILENTKMEETTSSGIIINSNDFTHIYKVISMSDELSIEKDSNGNYPFKVGDYVLIHPIAGGDITWNGKTYRTVKSWEIQAIVEINN